MDFKLNSTQIAEMLNSVTSQIPRPDGSKPLAWDDLTDNQRFHAAKAVEEIYSSPKRSAEELHTLWMAPLVESGWEYGDTYDHDNKKHPCMVPFGDLPESEICKDKIWEHLTEAFRPFYDGLKTEDFKNKIDNLVRIREENINKLKTIDDIFLYKSTYNFELSYYQSIIEKAYFEHCIKNKTVKYLEKNVWLLLKFLREFQLEFPLPDCEENLIEINDKIQKSIATYEKNVSGNNIIEFDNNISAAGNNFLKSRFKSYWKSKFNGNPSPVEAWQDDKIMGEVIKYRIGCNNSGEVFDFSLHQMVRGLSARRNEFNEKTKIILFIEYYIVGSNMPTYCSTFV